MLFCHSLAGFIANMNGLVFADTSDQAALSERIQVQADLDCVSMV